MNNGQHTIFWEYRWFESAAFKYSLPDLYHISLNKKLSVVRMLMHFRSNSVDLFGNIDAFSSDAYILALAQQLHKFINIMESLQLNTEVDVIMWTLTANKFYSVKSCYALINDGGIRSQYNKHIWKCCASLKINIFGWLAMHDKILSEENLIKKGWSGSSNCSICDCILESSEHIFLHCPMAVAVWDFFLYSSSSLIGTHIGDIFSLFQYVKFNLNSIGWNMLVLAVIWCL